MKKSFYSICLLSCLLLLSAVSRGASVPLTTGNPQNDTVCSGTVAWFVFVTSDTSATPAAITTTWQMSANGGSTWSAVTGGGAYTLFSDSLEVASSLALNGYLFRSIATNISGSDTSLSALLVVDTSRDTITGPTAVCVGAQITLNDSAAGGVWSATNDTALISSTGVVTGVFSGTGSSGNDTAGIDTIYYTVTNACIVTAITDTLIIAVNPLPPIGIITGASIVCKGATTPLANSVSGGVWNRSHPAIDSVSNTGIVGGLAQGFDTIMYTTTTGLCNASVTHPVRVDTVVTALPITGPTAVCRDGFIDLMNVNVLGTWAWSASNTRASISHSGVVTGLSYGLDTFTYSFTNACNTINSTSAPTQVDTPLSPGTIIGDSSVCAGSWIHLTETIAGGVWLSSNSSLAVVDGSGHVTGIAQGTPEISYIVSNGCGDTAATHLVTVNVPAGTITGSDSVGVDSTIILSDGTVGGSWSISNHTIATIGDTGVIRGHVTGQSTGTATVTYTVTNTCGTTYATMTLYVGPPPSVPAIAGLDSVCVGSSITLTDLVPGGVWASGNDTFATVDASTGVVTGIVSRYDTISYTVHNAFGDSTQLFPIFVSQPPVVFVTGPSLFYTGTDYIFLGVPYGGNTWGSKWTATNNIVGSYVIDSGLFISDTTIDSVYYTYASYSSFVVLNAGTDTLIYTVSNSCGTRSADLIVTPSGGSTNDHTAVVTGKSELLNLYPNPNNGEFTLNLASGSNEGVTVTITNVEGEKVTELTISTNKNYDIKLDQPEGIYIISATTASGHTYYSKVTVTK